MEGAAKAMGSTNFHLCHLVVGELSPVPGTKGATPKKTKQGAGPSQTKRETCSNRLVFQPAPQFPLHDHFLCCLKYQGIMMMCLLHPFGIWDFHFNGSVRPAETKRSETFGLPGGPALHTGRPRSSERGKGGGESHWQVSE